MKSAPDTMSKRRAGLIISILAFCLFVALIAVVILYDRTLRPGNLPGDQFWIDRAIREAAAEIRGETPQSIRKMSFPVVIHLSEQVCVELRTLRRRRFGGYQICYARDGRPVEQRIIGPTFP